MIVIANPIYKSLRISKADLIVLGKKRIDCSIEQEADYESIKTLKGVGDYTAAAISSFAFDLKFPVVDGNVFRLLSRHFGIDTAIDTSSGKKEFTKLRDRNHG